MTPLSFPPTLSSKLFIQLFIKMTEFDEEGIEKVALNLAELALA